MPSPDPQASPMGFLTAAPDELAGRVARAWEIFAEVAGEVDLAGRTRSSRRTARDMVIGLGSWPDSRGITDLVADALAGRTTTEPFAEAERRLALAHGDASDDEVRASIVASLADTTEWLRRGVQHSDGQRLTPSALGPLPIGTVMHAAAYQLAITARDLMPAGAAPRPELDELGLLALLDSSAAVAARIGLVASASAVGARVAVSIDVRDGGWTSVQEDVPDYPGVLGPEELLLDLSQGRADLSTMLRRVRFRRPRGLLALAPVIEDVPDLPGGALLRQVARWFGGGPRLPGWACRYRPGSYVAWAPTPVARLSLAVTAASIRRASARFSAMQVIPNLPYCDSAPSMWKTAPVSVTGS